MKHNSVIRHPMWQTTFNGAQVGVFAALAGCSLPPLLEILFAFISPGSTDLQVSIPIILTMLLVFVPFISFISVVPGLVGGSLLGPLFYYPAHRIIRPQGIGMLLGLVIGAGLGLISSLVFWRFPVLSFASYGDPAIGHYAIRDGMIAAVAGGLIGWRLGISNRPLPVFSDTPVERDLH